MIFQYTWENILSGKKTQTRRVISEFDKAILDESGDHITRVTHKGRSKWAVGKTYSVQPGRTKPSIARIEITRLRREPVRAITVEDALAEGFESVEEFYETWQQVHGKGSLDQEVWVIDFKLVDTSSM